MNSRTLAPPDAAAQHGPRPLPLFLDIVREQTECDPGRRAAVLKGLRFYQAAKRQLRVDDRPVAARHGRVRLLDYGGEGPPAVFVPSLINPPFVLDLADDRSLLRWLGTQGVRPMLVDWGDPRPPLEGEDVFHHALIVRSLLVQLDTPAHLIGYCLGGTMALAAAMEAELLSLTLIATPWHFTGLGVAARAEIDALWASAKPTCEQIGLVPMEVLQSGFWKLDPARTVAKYEAFGRMAPDSSEARGFVALEDWANAGAPLPYAAGRELFEDMIGADATGSGRWHGVDPSRLKVPTLEFVSLTDRIVPVASSPRLPGVRTLGLGHVGMIVGARARDQLWQPLAAMLSQPQRKR